MNPLQGNPITSDNSGSSSSSSVIYPLPYPTTFPNEMITPTNHPSTFQRAWSTCHLGALTVPRDRTFPSGSDLTHEKVLTALQSIEHLYQTDVTQPFGLGTKCAKTFVTRCLLGDKGTTYKYLGLRMFSTDWGAVGEGVIKQLNAEMQRQTVGYLNDLSSTRGRSTRGRSCFDVALINRMESSEKLKEEPIHKSSSAAVSWHADSSLEHFSTIGVYHVITAANGKVVADDVKEPEENKWRVALRVVHDVEGPTMTTRGATEEEKSKDATENAPILAVPLPNQSTYYLLDDYNHHHQHAVLAPLAQNETIRYSSTHRLIRQGGNVEAICERMDGAVRNFHKKSASQFRNEIAVYFEIESEWLRQFFIQGEGHRNLKWAEWNESIGSLLTGWGVLLRRIVEIVNFLRRAAMGSEGMKGADKKEGKKITKAFEQLRAIGGRKEGEDVKLYEVVGEGLEKIGKMRSLWKDRENDSVFFSMEKKWRPMTVPFPDIGVDLLGWETVGGIVRAWGGIVGGASGCGEDSICDNPFGNLKPEDSNSGASTSTSFNDNINDGNGNGNDENMTGNYALELQPPWSTALVSGKKTIETRQYELPSQLLGKKIDIIEIAKGEDGVSSNRADVVAGNDIGRTYKRVGWVVFESLKKYVSSEEFRKDEKKHCVEEGSGYDWKEGGCWGWKVSEFRERVGDENGDGWGGVKELRRIKRSIFQVISESSGSGRYGNVKGKKGKKKKRKEENGTTEDNKRKKKRY